LINGKTQEFRQKTESNTLSVKKDGKK